MSRDLRWVAQAREVLELELPADFADPHEPDLASVKFAALCIGAVIVGSTKVGVVPILDETRRIRVWFDMQKAIALGFATEVSYDGGRSFENPLDHYR